MAKTKKKEYSVTIGYKAIIEVTVTAEDEETAKQYAMHDFENKFRLPGASNISISDDNYKISGILNMTETWNSLNT